MESSRDADALREADPLDECEEEEAAAEERKRERKGGRQREENVGKAVRNG